MEYSLMDDNYCGISLISTLKEFTNAELIHVKLIFGAIIFADFFQIRKNLFRKIFSKSALRKNQFHKMFQNVFFKTQHLFFRITESTKERFDQKLKSRQEGQEIIKNGWHQALHRQSNTVSAVASVRSTPGKRSNGVLRKFWRAPVISQCRSQACKCFFA